VADPAGFDFDLDLFGVERAWIELDLAECFPSLACCPSVKGFAHGWKMAWENVDASVDSREIGDDPEVRIWDSAITRIP
jgi:hypothetical protein